MASQGAQQEHKAVKRGKLLTSGLIGTAVAAICCFTPALVILLGALGLSTWLGWLDLVLIPTLVFFAGLSGYVFLARRRAER